MPGAYHVLRASAAAATAINTAQAAVNDITGTSAGAIVVPTDLRQNLIAAVYGGFAVSTWTSTSVGSIFSIRLTGGVNAGQQDLAITGLQNIITTSGARVAEIYFQMPLALTGAAIPITTANPITVAFFQVSGVSLGTWSGCVTFVLV